MPVALISTPASGADGVTQVDTTISLAFYLNMSKQSSRSAAALRHVLLNHKASEIETSGEVVEIDSTVSPMDAAKVLWEKNILGAPVWDDKQRKYVGFFDMRDILSAVIASHKEHEAEDKGTSPALMATWFGKMHLSTSYLAARNPFVSCKADAPLEEVCTVLAKQTCHRIPILNDEGRCTAIISQSALVKFLVERVKDNLDETLDEAGLEYRKDIISAKDTASALDVFELLDSNRLSGIAVVDEEDGHLVGNTSARDIKMLVFDEGKSASLDMDILSYLAALRQATPVKKERYPSAHVTETSTVGHAIRLLSKTGYHRVFVVDKDVKPVGVISVADVIRFAISD
jgi:CBS domain-containing protein